MPKSASSNQNQPRASAALFSVKPLAAGFAIATSAAFAAGDSGGGGEGANPDRAANPSGTVRTQAPADLTTCAVGPSVGSKRKKVP